MNQCSLFFQIFLSVSHEVCVFVVFGMIGRLVQDFESRECIQKVKFKQLKVIIESWVIFFKFVYQFHLNFLH